MNVAPLKKRFGALIIDYFVILAYALCLLAVTMLVYYFFFDGVLEVNSQSAQWGFHALGFVSLTLPVGMYFYITESGSRHATFGKRVAKLVVVGKNGAVATKVQILTRTVVKLLPWEFAHTFVYQLMYYGHDGATPPAWVMIGLIIANIIPLAYVITILCRKDRRGPHDLVAGTLVAITQEKVPVRRTHNE